MSFIQYKLYFYQDGKLFRKVALEKNKPFTLNVGRGVDSKKENKLGLRNKRISSQHLKIIYTRDGFIYVQDNQSLNGTFLNGNKIKADEKRELRHKDKLQLAGASGVLIRILKEGSERSVHTQTDIIDKLKIKKRVVVGRSKSCDVVINHPTVSSHHLSIEKISSNEFLLKDLSSLNGTFVNGEKVRRAKKIGISDKIFIGRHQIKLKGKVKDLGDELAIRAVGIEKIFKNGDGLQKTDLDIPSGSLLCVMGPSGCGKSTLLKALNGDTPPSKGKIQLFGQDLITNYKFLKTKIGYVPQEDIIHKDLTVYQSLYYTAKLRLGDVDDSDINNKIEETLKKLRIYKKRNALIKKLSGGQKKRVCIALELLADPLILFLDEPTSPLDPGTIKDFLDTLNNLSDQGTTVIMVTHKPEDLEFMQDVIFMAEGGDLVYYGSKNGYRDYFGVRNVYSVYNMLVRENSQGRKNPQHQALIKRYQDEKPFSEITGNPKILKKESDKDFIAESKWLIKRYFSIKTNDKANSLIMLIQAPIIAILILLIFPEIDSAVLFLAAISAIWFGTNNAAREIVSESVIYKRERMFNLNILPYIFSKVFVLSFFSIIQAVLFIIILFFGFEGASISLQNPFSAIVWMSFLSIASTFLGLLLSSFNKMTAEKVMSIVPIVLIPQIMLAGLITKIDNQFVEFCSWFTLSRWGTEKFHEIQENIFIKWEVNGVKFTDTKEAVKELHKQFHESYKDVYYENIALISISIMIVLMIFSLYKILKNKDSVTI